MSRAGGIRVWWPALAWAAFIFVLSAIPGTKFPEVKTPYADKMVHLALYIVLGVFCLRGVRSWGLGGARAVAVAALLAAAYGVSDELHQIFTPYRTADWHDAAADAVGGLAGALGALLLRRRPSHLGTRPDTDVVKRM